MGMQIADEAFDDLLAALEWGAALLLTKDGEGEQWSLAKAIARNGLTSQLANTLIFKHLTRVKCLAKLLN